MRRWRESGGRSGLVLWASASIMALGAHLGLAWWILHEPDAAMHTLPADAMMVELAAERMAATNETRADLAPDLLEMQAAAPSKKQEAEKPEPVEKPMPEPDREPEPETEKKVDKAEVAIPSRRPEPVRRSEEAQEAQADSRAAPAPRTSAPSKVEAPRADRLAAPQAVRGVRVPNDVKVTWQARLGAHLARYKRYPSDARANDETGIVYMRMFIERDGAVSAASVYRSSGYAALDRAAMVLVEEASPVPPPPEGMEGDIVVPLRYNLEGR